MRDNRIIILKTRKRISIILVFAMLMALLISGCSKSKSSNATQEGTKDSTEVSDSSQGTSSTNESAAQSSIASTDNATNKMNKIGLYIHGQDLSIHNLITEYVSNWEKGKDIECFEAFTTNEKTVTGNGFKNAWEPYWNKYSDAADCKIGYCLTFTLNSSEVFTKTIKAPTDTAQYFNYIELYIYDDVHQTQGVWYTHLSESDIKDNTFMTSIKLTAGSKISEVKDIKLSAFTYSSAKDFDPVTGMYIGKNSYEITVTRSK
ncbi:hypothetical protein [[Clostridium] fimetarium]|uniref:Lipoprotein n=1 Tax=[Clostridium] fimetarium TaxID=99656 RepID=A0A1I0Q9G6_9FIRM|nr:hypothetical protein [[Clostridium] fimetarium]SEW23520.1 hypothetical protein SAMN05421659_107104 [[Clostridium] fimetarium]